MHHALRLFLFSLVAATIACGSNKNNSVNGEAENIQEESGKIFQVIQNSAQISARNGNGELKDIALFAYDSIVMLEEEMVDGEGQVWKAVVVDNNSESGSEVYYMKAQDLAQISMKEVTESDDSDWSVLREARMTYCYKYVKQYLLKIGLVKTYLPGGSAYMAANILPKYGFKKVSRKPSQAIVNDVCVYKGGPSGHGHIEIKTSKGWYYGYGYKANPIQNRIFTGCFHK